MSNHHAQTERHMRNSLLIFVASFIGMLLWQVAGHIAATIFYRGKGLDMAAAQQEIAHNQGMIAFFNIGMELVLGIVVLFFVMRVEKKAFSLKELSLQADPRNTGRYFIGAAITLFINAVIWPVYIVLHFTQLEHIEWIHQSIGDTMIYLIGMLFYSAFAGILEEVLFRGYIANRLYQKYGTAISIVISSLLFAIMHVIIYPSLSMLLYVFCMGVLLGILYMKTQSLYIAIGLHWSWDFVSKLIDNDGSHPGIVVLKPFAPGYADASVYLLAIVIALVGIASMLMRNTPQLQKQAIESQ